MGDGIRLRHRRSSEEIVHVWYKHELITQYGYKQVEGGTGNLRIYEEDTLYQTSERNLSFDSTTGLFDLSNGGQAFTYEEMSAEWDDSYPLVRLSGYYRTKNSNRVNTVYVSTDGSSTTDGRNSDPPYMQYNDYRMLKSEIDTSNVLGRSKGNYIEQVKSNNGSAFPQNSYQNGYWYVYSHSYKK
jgi:hypothetical protein